MHGAPARAIEATGPGGPRLQLLVEGSASSLESVPAGESDKYRDPGDSSGAPERHNGHAPGSHVDASKRNTARRGNPTGPTERSMRAATPNRSAPVAPTSSKTSPADAPVVTTSSTTSVRSPGERRKPRRRFIRPVSRSANMLRAPAASATANPRAMAPTAGATTTSTAGYQEAISRDSAMATSGCSRTRAFST